MNLLNEIVAHKREELKEKKAATALEALRERAAQAAQRPGLVDALRGAPIGLIAEVKRRSPSAGPIRDPFDPVAIAQGYETAGAQAISVLMDAKYFGGGEDDFRKVRAAVDLPLLYKEFVVDPWQVWHAASLGASAVLLIAAVLERDELASLQAVCGEAGLEALVEVHAAEEMDVAAAVGASLVGINNRNLKTFEVSLEMTLRLADVAPSGCTLISESGIRSADDVARLHEAGVRGILVGEHLLRQKDTTEAVAKLMAKVWASS